MTRDLPEPPPSDTSWLEVEPYGRTSPDYHDGRARGYLAEPERQARHRCAPPISPYPPDRPPPQARIGSVWRCTCGRLWYVAEDSILHRGRVFVNRRRWVRAGLAMRWRYRHAANIDTRRT